MAAATASITSTSTWPPPTVWNSTTGFSPIIAAAYGLTLGPHPADEPDHEPQRAQAGGHRDGAEGLDHVDHASGTPR